MTELPVLFVDKALPPGFADLFAGRATVVGPDSAALDGAAAIIAGSFVWHADAIASLPPSVLVISRSGIGYDTVDLVAATAKGVVVCNAPEAPTVSTAEHAVTLLLAAAKRVMVSQAKLRRADGDYGATNDGIELENLTLGLIGYGRIARRVGTAMAALGMSVITCDPYVDHAQLAAGVEAVELAELLARSDAISVHAPLTDETRHLFDSATFAATKPGVVFVNTARGGVVDHDALLAALDSGQVLAAGLDVTDPEPLPVDHPLLGRDDVVVTPHIASSTTVGLRRLYDHAIVNALTVAAGERPATVVNPEVYPS